jgi:DNA-binding YbaB/EbfC family protein
MDINKLMKQAQEMQKQVKSAQTEMARKEFEGKSGGGLVSITMTGDGKMRKIDLDPSLIKVDEKEILEDLIVAAYHEAKQKADQESQNNISGMFDPSNIPSF